MLEQEIVVIFSDIAELFGNPRSHGAIYGLLFIAEMPLTMEEIVQRLNISKGSASQGLRYLEEFHAVNRLREKGTRSHHYAARLELKPLISGFFRQRLLPKVRETGDRLQRLSALLPSLSQDLRKTAEHRLDRLNQWHRQASLMLPLAKKLFDAD
jgi:DNA-binding transcriptional regulator GbsR (MarR family)